MKVEMIIRIIKPINILITRVADHHEALREEAARKIVIRRITKILIIVIIVTIL